MNENEKRDQRHKTLQKLRKVIGESTIEELEALSADDLRRRIARCQSQVLETKEQQNADEDLAALKESLKVAREPYTAAMKRQQAIASFAAHLLEEKGAAE